jgi:NAD-dependent SIR2 family protein deacetylase
MSAMSQKQRLQQAAALIRQHHRIVAFTGAGISTESGIPDLDGIDQILKRTHKFAGNVFRFLDPKEAIADPHAFYQMYRQTFCQPQARPNNAHKALVQLEQAKKLLGVVTMNVDYLHQKAGTHNIAEYWGDVRRNHCTICHRPSDWQKTPTAALPICPNCGGLILPDFVLRHLATYPDEIRHGQQMLAQADLLLIIGTRQSASGFRLGCPKIVINASRVSMENLAEPNTVYLSGKAAEILSSIVA